MVEHPTEFALISCSKSKKSGIHFAKDIYTPSDVFNKRVNLVKQNNIPWGILSAKHGYLRRTDIISDYDTHISERTNVWGGFVLRDLLAHLSEFNNIQEITIYAGKRYIEPIKPALEERGYIVNDPHKGMMSGERKQALKRKLQRGEQKTMTDF